MSIYDRSKWPPPEENPILVLLRRDQEWFENRDVVEAFKDEGQVTNQMPVGPTTLYLETLGIETKVDMCGKRVWRRWYTKKGIVLMAMRARTLKAQAFRDWMAAQIAGGLQHG